MKTRDLYQFILGIIVLGVIIAVCHKTPYDINPTGLIDQVKLSADVSRFIDEQARVVCWTYYRGISCLPIGETNLRLK